MPQITLTLSLDDTNLVLEALGAMPYARVYELIAGIQAQAHAGLAGGAPVTPIGAEGHDEDVRRGA